MLAITSRVKEILVYRELLLALTHRDIRVKYKQAAMGVLWVFFLPVLAITSGIIFRLVISILSDKPLELADMVAVMVKSIPWVLFSGIVGGSSSSLVGNMGLITKIYFPREVIPLSKLLTSLFDFSISITGLIVILTLISFFYTGPVAPVVISASLLWVPVLLAVMLLLAMSLGLALSCANLFFRDVKYIVGLVLQFGIMFSLVYFTYEELGQWGWLLLINPVAPLLEGIRTAVINGQVDPFLWPWIAYSVTVAVVMLFVASRSFERAEHLFAEYV